jgi:hypothetical protein
MRKKPDIIQTDNSAGINHPVSLVDLYQSKYIEGQSRLITEGQDFKLSGLKV